MRRWQPEPGAGPRPRRAARRAVRPAAAALCLAVAAAGGGASAARAGVAAGHVLGVHVHEPGVAQGLGPSFGAYRLWDTGTAWRRLEPQRGAWAFERLDAYVALAERQQRPVMLTLGSTPEWASARPQEPCSYGQGCAAPPADLRDWRRYVEAVSRRYRGRIECYEIWNEVRFHHGEDPRDRGGAPMFYSGTLDELLALTRIAAEVIRAQDPKACVLAPSFHVYGDWIRNLDRYLAAGAARWIDGISFHFYADRPERSVGALREVGRTLARHGLSGARLWNTEFGFPAAVFEGDARRGERERRLAALIARSAILGASYGVERSYWYAYDNRKMGLYHAARAELAGFESALQGLADALRDQRFSGCGPLQGELWRCMTTGPDGRGGMVLWSAARDFGAACARLSLPAQLQVRALGRPDRYAAEDARVCVGPTPMLLQSMGQADDFPRRTR